MTAKLATPYGIKEVSVLYHKYAFSGLSVGVIFQFIVIGLYFALRAVGSPDVIVPNFQPGKRVITFEPTASPGGFTTIQIPVAPTYKPADRGTPVPVPIAEVTEEPKYESSQVIPGTVGGNIGETGAVTGDPGGSGPVIIDEDPVDLSTTFLESMIIPRVARQVKPEYPRDAVRLGLEGLVVVKLLINKEGRPEKAEIYSPPNEIFDASAKTAAMQWLFTPAIANGHIVSVWMNIPFRFKLNRE